MTRPSIICFVGENGNDRPKIFIRTLLYATSEQGQYIQNMFIRLTKGELIKDFNIWAYGDNGLVRGSGLFVNKAGISSYHHFLLPEDEHEYFTQGFYTLEVFAETINKSAKKIFEQNLSITQEQALSLSNGMAIYHDWAPNIEQYISHIDYRIIN
ncbi:MAG: hypothetical protein EOO43_07210 [Flavobacterium sp.]|nr:MAG: hypothetical protein EOO43_07210 [Flavobacterium sp.]